MLAILIAESENELTIAAFLRATKHAIRSEIDTLREVLFLHLRLHYHSMLTIDYTQELNATRKIMNELLEQHSTETDLQVVMISWNLPAFLHSYMRNPVLRRNPWPEVHLVSVLLICLQNIVQLVR